MNRRAVTIALALVVASSLAGCRQADGPMPAATDDVPNRLGDLSRDLMAAARGDQQAPQDLADDLRVFAPAAAAPAVDELSRRTAGVVAGRPLTDEHAQQLSHHLWTAVAATQYTERQVDALQTELQSYLVSLGVPQERAENVAAQVDEVQKQVSQRPRRWYEWF